MRKQGLKVSLKTPFKKELYLYTETWNLVEANRMKASNVRGKLLRNYEPGLKKLTIFDH